MLCSKLCQNGALEGIQPADAEEMLIACTAPLRSKRIHIGMDEAHRLGRGRYRDKHGERNRADILLEHLGILA